MSNELKEIGTCALCGAIIYSDDSGYINYREGLFCTVSCAEEATGDQIKTGKQFKNGYLCPYCNQMNGINEGCSDALINGTIMIDCAYCKRESISDHKVRDPEPKETNGKQYQIIIEGSNRDEVYKLFEEIQNNYSFYDNCIFLESLSSDTIVDSGRTQETGNLYWNPQGDIGTG